jgi:hypothetical protein
MVYLILVLVVISVAGCKSSPVSVSIIEENKTETKSPIVYTEQINLLDVSKNVDAMVEDISKITPIKDAFNLTWGGMLCILLLYFILAICIVRYIEKT